MEEIKPCPFCAGKSYLAQGWDCFYVTCENCYSDGPVEETEQKAIESWNTRKGEK